MLLTHPSSPQAAQALARKLGNAACFIAGGTLLQQSWPEPRLAPSATHFINVMHWPEMQQISLGPQYLHIGAGMRLEAVRRHPWVQQHAPVLVQALDQLGAMGIRRLGTLGGNIGWGEGDCCPVLLAMDAQVELTDGNLQSLAQTLKLMGRPLMLSFLLPRRDVMEPRPLVFEKVGYRAAFSPARLRMALRWSDAQKRLSLDCVAVAAPGIGVHRLQATEKLLSYAQELQIRPSLGDIRTTCEQSLPPDLARIASRLIAGHCGLLA